MAACDRCKKLKVLATTMTNLLVDLRGYSTGETTWVPEEKEKVFEMLRKLNSLKLPSDKISQVFEKQFKKLQLHNSMLIDLATARASIIDLEKLGENHG